MTPEQEEKFKAWIKRIKWGDIANSCKTAWIACLEANGIGEDVKGKDDEAAAPQWVIDMMRTGKPVRCRVWDEDEKGGGESLVDGYCLCSGGGEYRYEDTMGTPWKHAEPIPAWKPKEGEAVFVVRGEDTDVSVCRFSHIDEKGIWRVVTVKGQEQGFTDSLVKPFDASKIGKPWSEV